jgi:hypothetical protein
MTTMRLRRLEQYRGKPWLDPNDVAIPPWAALDASADAGSAGRPFSWLPHRRFPRRTSTKLKDGDRVVERPRAEPQGGYFPAQNS